MKDFTPQNDFVAKALSPKIHEDFSGHVILNKRAIVKRAIASTNNRSSFASISSTSLISRDSVDSVSSLLSSSTTDSESHQSGKRRIFSGYWQKHQHTGLPLIDQLNSGIASLIVNEPRSPLLEHYPTRSIESCDALCSQGHDPSPTLVVSDFNNNDDDDDLKKTLSITPPRRSTLIDSDFNNNEDDLKKTLSMTPPRRSTLVVSDFDDLKKTLSITPPRRSIFGTADNQTLHCLDQYFLTHQHMRVVSSSVDSLTEPSTSSASAELPLKRRPRSHSCCDATIAASRKVQRPLHSCLKRGSRHITGSQSSDDIFTSNKTESVLQRRPSVHFDSQISIVAFQAPASYESVSCTDGSWTKIFEH